MDMKRSARIPNDVEMPCRERQADRQTDRQTGIHGESLLVPRPEGNQPSLWTSTLCDCCSCDTRTLSHTEATDTMQTQLFPLGLGRIAWPALSMWLLAVWGTRQPDAATNRRMCLDLQSINHPAGKQILLLRFLNKGAV